MKTELGVTDEFQLQAELNGIASAFGGAPVETQTGFSFPQPLTEKYRPHVLDGYVGLEKPKKVMQRLINNPFPSAWFFLGPSGTGKTTFGLAIAECMPAELHHVPSKECTLETVKDIARVCHNMPRMADTWKPCRMHLVLVDEADQMSYPAQLAFLSLLDATAFPPNTIFIFTGNSIDNLEDRFMSRMTGQLKFSSYGMAEEIAGLLAKVWDAETDNPTERPDFARLVKDAKNNVREALNSLQTEIMAA